MPARLPNRAKPYSRLADSVRSDPSLFVGFAIPVVAPASELQNKESFRPLPSGNTSVAPRSCGPVAGIQILRSIGVETATDPKSDPASILRRRRLTAAAA